MNKQPKIYFAYGSNLNLEDMKVRCPTARLLGAGRAEGHELMFRGHTGCLLPHRCAQSRPLCSHRCL